MGNNSLYSVLPIYRYCNDNNMHLYTQNWGELGMGGGGFKFEQIEFFAARYEFEGVVPLYRSFNGSVNDHLYSTDEGECSRNGYRVEGILCYVAPVLTLDMTTKLYRYYNPISKDHFYTTNINEIPKDGYLGYNFEDICGYVIKAKGE